MFRPSRGVKSVLKWNNARPQQFSRMYSKEVLPSNPLDLLEGEEGSLESMKVPGWRQHFDEVDRIMRTTSRPIERNVALLTYAKNFPSDRLSAKMGNLRLMNMKNEDGESIAKFVECWFHMPELEKETHAAEYSHKAIPDKNTYHILSILFATTGQFDAFNKIWKVGFAKYGFRDLVLYNYILRCMLVHSPNSFGDFVHRHFRYKLNDVYDEPDQIVPNMETTMLMMRHLAYTQDDPIKMKIFWEVMKQHHQKTIDKLPYEEQTQMVRDYNRAQMFSYYRMGREAEADELMQTYYNMDNTFARSNLPDPMFEFKTMKFKKIMVERGRTLRRFAKTVEQKQVKLKKQMKNWRRSMGAVQYDKFFREYRFKLYKESGEFTKQQLMDLEAALFPEKSFQLKDSESETFKTTWDPADLSSGDRARFERHMAEAKRTNANTVFPPSKVLKSLLYNNSLQFKPYFYTHGFKVQQGKPSPLKDGKFEDLKAYTDEQKFYRMEIYEAMKKKIAEDFRYPTASGVEKLPSLKKGDMGIVQKYIQVLSKLRFEERRFHATELVDFLNTNDPKMCRQFILQNYNFQFESFSKIFSNFDKSINLKELDYPDLDLTIFTRKLGPSPTIFTYLYKYISFANFEEKEMFMTIAANKNIQTETRFIKPTALYQKISKGLNKKAQKPIILASNYRPKEMRIQDFEDMYDSEIRAIEKYEELQHKAEGSEALLRSILVPDIAMKLNSRVYKPGSLKAHKGRLVANASHLNQAQARALRKEKLIEREMNRAKNWKNHNKHGLDQIPEVKYQPILPGFEVEELGKKKVAMTYWDGKQDGKGNKVLTKQVLELPKNPRNISKQQLEEVQAKVKNDTRYSALLRTLHRADMEGILFRDSFIRDLGSKAYPFKNKLIKRMNSTRRQPNKKQKQKREEMLQEIESKYQKFEAQIVKQTVQEKPKPQQTEQKNEQKPKKKKKLSKKQMAFVEQMQKNKEARALKRQNKAFEEELIAYSKDIRAIKKQGAREKAAEQDQL